MVSFRHIAVGASALATLSAAAFTPAFAQSANGATLFNQRCKVCHIVEAGKTSATGPNLRGVVGRKAATAKYNYSAAMKKSAKVWDKASLDKYLAAPTKAVPGGKMVIAVADAAQRKAIIEFLATQR